MSAFFFEFKLKKPKKLVVGSFNAAVAHLNRCFLHGNNKLFELAGQKYVDTPQMMWAEPFR